MGSLQDKIYKKAEENLIPILVHFDVTYRCNLNCIHCYLPEKDRYPSASYREELKSQNRSELTTQEIFGILDQLAECGTLFLTFSSGEIFVRKDLMDIVKYARKANFSVSLMTTGTIGFDENVADILAEIGIQSVDISLYSSDPEIHDSVTGIPGSFDKTMKAIKLFKERKVNTRIKCPLMTVNAKTFKDLITLAESLDVDWLFDPNLTVRTDGNKQPTTLKISDEELKEYYTHVINISKKEEKETKEITAPLCDTELDESPCGASHSSCYISPYGDVQACIDISINCGNLREKPFEDIWENSEDMLMVRAIKRGDLRNCLDCPKTDYCHRCIGQSYLEHSSLLDPSERFCKITKINYQLQKEIRQNEKEKIRKANVSNGGSF